MSEQKHVTNNYDYAKLAMSWSGWGSPVGLGACLVSIGLFLWLLHLATII